jgi:pilus assembly protein CpaB
MTQGRGRRTGVVLIVLIIIVLLVAVGALFLLRFMNPTPATDTTANGQATDEAPDNEAPEIDYINVIVADRDILRGTRMSVEDVRIMQWPDLPDAAPPVDALIVGPNEGDPGLEQVEGRIARYDIVTDQPVLNSMLTEGDDPTTFGERGSDAALLIPQGQVAVALPVSRLSSVGYAVRAGDHVDIMMSFRFVNVDEDFQTITPNSGVLITDDPTLLFSPMFGFDYDLGREEAGAFGTTLLVFPNLAEPMQRPRQATQLMIDNAIVLRVGQWPYTDVYEPIIVTAVPPATAAPAPEEGTAAPATEEVPPTATPVPPPDIVTLIMGRQDALVLKYALETGATIDLALRSYQDNAITDIQTETVTLQYIIDFYNVTIPPPLPIAQDPRIDNFSRLDQFTLIAPKSTVVATPLP